jgi:hypothetical protein
VIDRTNVAIQLKLSQNPHLNQVYPKVSPPVNTTKSLFIACILRAWHIPLYCCRLTTAKRKISIGNGHSTPTTNKKDSRRDARCIWCVLVAGSKCDVASKVPCRVSPGPQQEAQRDSNFSVMPKLWGLPQVSIGGNMTAFVASLQLRCAFWAVLWQWDQQINCGYCCTLSLFRDYRWSNRVGAFIQTIFIYIWNIKRLLRALYCSCN